MAAAEQIDPTQANAAQIPLSDFQLPDFPPSATSLQSLILTSDINPTEYTSLLSQPCPPVPVLPPSISALTLELFSLGYPAGFLDQLGHQLPNLKSLVLYSQLFGGLTADTQADALRFLERALKDGKLRGLHWLDVFSQRGFVKAVGMVLQAERKEREEKQKNAKGGLLFLEVNYTTQLGGGGGDDDFSARLLPDELPSLVVKSLVTCAFNIAPPLRTDDEQDPTNLDDEGKVVKRDSGGASAFEKKHAKLLVDALLAEDTRPHNLKMVNTTLYTLGIKDLEDILAAHAGLAVVNATIEFEGGSGKEWKESLLKVFKKCDALEQVEVVVNPGGAADKDAVQQDCFVNKTDLDELSKSLPALASFKMNVLRNESLPSLDWEKTDQGEWKKI